MRPECLFIVQNIHILAFKILAYNYGRICYLIAPYPSLLASAATAASPSYSVTLHCLLCSRFPWKDSLCIACCQASILSPIYYSLLRSQILANIEPKDLT